MLLLIHYLVICLSYFILLAGSRRSLCPPTDPIWTGDTCPPSDAMQYTYFHFEANSEIVAYAAAGGSLASRCQPRLRWTRPGSCLSLKRQYWYRLCSTLHASGRNPLRVALPVVPKLFYR